MNRRFVATRRSHGGPHRQPRRDHNDVILSGRILATDLLNNPAPVILAATLLVQKGELYDF
jgi:hypothetical protein